MKVNTGILQIGVLGIVALVLLELAWYKRKNRKLERRLQLSNSRSDN